MRISLLVALNLTIAVAACSEAQKEPPPSAQASDLPNECEGASECRVFVTSGLPELCERDAPGQVACLANTFELDSCDTAQVLGSMFRGDEAEGTHLHRTAFGLSTNCVSELKKAAKRRNFRENDKGELIAKPRTGYGETLIVGLQISADGSVVEWERVQE